MWPALVCSVLVLLGALTAPAPASAYSAPGVYGGLADDGGGGGRWFTGSPAEGFGCSVCHTSTPGAFTYPLRISGVPFRGYEAERTYGITLGWPEFEQRWKQVRPDPMAPLVDGQDPAVSMLAEFVPENGQASGTVEIIATVTDGPEMCEMRRSNIKPRLGASLWQVRPAVEETDDGPRYVTRAIEIEPNKEGIIRCEAKQLGQRCIIAMQSCGAHQVRLRWTPPDAVAPGPIWFSAGFVATDNLSETPEGDSVFEFSAPMVPEGSPSDSYEAVLEGAPCSVSGVGRNGGAWPAWALGLGACWLLSRSRSRGGRRRADKRERGHG